MSTSKPTRRSVTWPITSSEAGSRQGIRIEAEVNGRAVEFVGEGNGPVEAAVAAIGAPIRVQSFEERSMGEGADAAAIVHRRGGDGRRSRQPLRGGMHRNTVTASVRAIISAANRAGVQVSAVAEDAEAAQPDFQP